MVNPSPTGLARNTRSVDTSEAFQQRWLPAVFRLLAVALGSIHTWAAIVSYSMSEDGINYLDIGDAYIRGDWNMALNSVWSPLYSWILGPIMRLSSPSMRWEFAVVQLVNLAIYVAALGCFGFFWRQLTYWRQMRTAAHGGGSHVAWSEWAWVALGYSLFIWSSLTLIKIWVVTPDMLMAALVYLAAGLVLRIRLGHTDWLTFSLLGMVLGLGYLSKAVMFPLSLVFLAVSLFSAPGSRRALPRVLAALLVFLVFSAPFIWAVSSAKGRLTFGDAGTLTYVRYVNDVPYPHWQGEPAGSGTPEHPSRQILDDPPIYEFGAPIGGTYPIAYDPSYWYEGVVAHADARQQLRLVLSSTSFYFDLFLRQQGILVAAVLTMYWMRSRRQSGVIDLVRGWGLAVVALVAFVMYALVYAEARYVGVFVVLLWADLLANLCLPHSQVSTKLVSRLSTTMVLFLFLSIVAFNVKGFSDLSSSRNGDPGSSQQARSPSWPGEVAQELHRLGIQRGDKVGVIGYGFSSFWARLARVQIVAEMLRSDADPFWKGDAVLQSRVVQAFASTDAEAIVAEHVPSYADLGGWHRVEDSNYYICILAE
jgi:hypothetical protein